MPGTLPSRKVALVNRLNSEPVHAGCIYLVARSPAFIRRNECRHFNVNGWSTETGHAAKLCTVLSRYQRLADFGTETKGISKNMHEELQKCIKVLAAGHKM